MALSLESVDEILKCDHDDHSNKSYGAVSSRGGLIMLYSTMWLFLWSLWMKSKNVTIQIKATGQYLHVVVLLCCTIQCGSFFGVCG